MAKDENEDDGSGSGWNTNMPNYNYDNTTRRHSYSEYKQQGRSSRNKTRQAHVDTRMFHLGLTVKSETGKGNGNVALQTPPRFLPNNDVHRAKVCGTIQQSIQEQTLHNAQVSTA